VVYAFKNVFFWYLVIAVTSNFALLFLNVVCFCVVGHFCVVVWFVFVLLGFCVCVWVVYVCFFGFCCLSFVFLVLFVVVRVFVVLFLWFRFSLYAGFFQIFLFLQVAIIFFCFC